MRISRQVPVGGVTKPELLLRLARAGVELNDAARALFADPRFVMAEEATLLQCVETDLRELGLRDGGTFARALEAAAYAGLSVAPLELGPQLRLILVDQAEGLVGFPSTQHRAPPGSITIASAPLDEEEETPKGFYLRRMDGKVWLRGYRSWPGHVWDAEDHFVFVVARPRP